MKKHRRSKQQHTPIALGGWLIRGVMVITIGLIGWWAITAFSAIKQKINPFPANNHPFITSQADNPVILIIQQTTPGSLQSLAVARVDHHSHTVSVVELPTTLSDGQTTAAEYLASGYYKELQQMVEQTIALPINSYMVQTAPSRATDWARLMIGQPKPNWWQTTLGAPWWLSQQPILQTNMSAWQLTQTLWLIRDTADSQRSIKTAPTTMFIDRQGLLVADTTQLDSLVGQALVDSQASQAVVSLVVKNATQVSGLAALVARYAQHMGGDIVAVEPADTNQTTTSLKAEKTSVFSQNMTQLLGVPLTVASRTGRERSDAELIVGVDALTRIGKPQQ
jgi:hypothetical protein